MRLRNIVYVFSVITDTELDLTRRLEKYCVHIDARALTGVKAQVRWKCSSRDHNVSVPNSPCTGARLTGAWAS